MYTDYQKNQRNSIIILTLTCLILIINIIYPFTLASWYINILNTFYIIADIFVIFIFGMLYVSFKNIDKNDLINDLQKQIMLVKIKNSLNNPYGKIITNTLVFINIICCLYLSWYVTAIIYIINIMMYIYVKSFFNKHIAKYIRK